MRALVRSVWDEPRVPDAPARVWRDWVLLVVLVPIALLEGLLRPELNAQLLQTAVAAGLVPTLLWRRTRPLPMALVAFGITGVVPLLIGGPLDMNVLVYTMLLPYAACRWGSGREALLTAAIIVVVVGTSAVVGHIGPTDVIAGVAVVSTALASGAAFRYRDRERTRTLEQVALLERERLARELHDTVAHHVSAMAIRAQAGIATAASRPGAATDALRVIEEEATRALAEMRAIVRVLRRDQPAALAPGPRIADVGLLAGGPGPAVAVEFDGDLDGVSPSVAAAVYRLAQESITNARRHARNATRIDVRVAIDDRAVRLRVSDDGEPGPAAPPGYGLRGMIERVTLLGGVCAAGPGPDRGWTVTAELPR